MSHWEICDDCHGEGRHSKAVDGNGITSSEWAEWSDEDREGYFAGAYDQTCGSCAGSGKVRVLDEDEEAALRRCKSCNGTGRNPSNPDDLEDECEDCWGTGETDDYERPRGQNPCVGCSRRYSEDPMACECCEH